MHQTIGIKNMNILKIGRTNTQLDNVLHIIRRQRVTQNSTIEIDKVARFASGTIITGLLTCSDNCYFNGKMDGSIEVRNKLVLGQNSEVYGSIYAGDLMAKGKIEGRVKVNNKTIYSSTSSFVGESLQTSFLEVENGAILNLSNISMLQAQSIKASSDLTIENRTEQNRTDIEAKRITNPKEREKAKKESDSITDNNDDTLLFQFFQNKKNEQ